VLSGGFKALYIIIEDCKSLMRLAKVFIGL
jgi:hypothetical protein